MKELKENIGPIFILLVTLICTAIVAFKFGFNTAVGSAWLYKVEHRENYETVVMEFDGQLHDYRWFYDDEY